MAEGTSIDRTKEYAYRLINYRPRSEKELEERLKRQGASREDIGRVISELKKEGLIDDRNFSRLWIKMRSRESNLSLYLVKRELILKGVDRDLINEVADELKGDFNEEEIAKDALRRRLRSVEGLDKKKKISRLFNYLKRRGFSDQLIWKAMDEVK